VKRGMEKTNAKNEYKKGFMKNEDFLKIKYGQKRVKPNAKRLV